MLRKLLTASLLAALLAVAAVATASPVEARHGRHGAIVRHGYGYGAAHGYAEPSYDYGYAPIYGPHCRVESGFVHDSYGGQFARIRLCD